jgi:transcription antitermination factor NusG
MAKRSKYVWAIGHIDKEHIFRVQSDIDRIGLNVEAYIPTIRVLSKRHKSHSVYANIPLMMNYGFFKVLAKDIKNYEYMNRLRDCSPCIISWLKNTANAQRSKLRKNLDEAIPIAYTHQPFITRLEELQRINDVYSPHELQQVSPGETLTLQCYPFEGMQAKVIKVDLDKRKVKVELLDALQSTFFKERIDLDFEHVFFTVYKSETDENSLMKNVSYFEDFKERNKNHKSFKDANS